MVTLPTALFILPHCHEDRTSLLAVFFVLPSMIFVLFFHIQDYADTLSHQINAAQTSDKPEPTIGQHIEEPKLDDFKQDQLEQLYELAQETNKPHVPLEEQS